ncbi:MAG: efflux RND transporter periplasmic adaptor subunit [Chlamydiota bacterium]
MPKSHWIAPLQTLERPEFVKTAQDYEHRKQLIDEGGVSLEDLEHAAAALQASYGELVATEHQFIGAAALVENTTLASHPIVASAQNNLRDAYVFLQRCTIEAPVEGVVAQRSVQVGEHVSPGDPLMAIVPLDQMWIDANYKEVQLSKVRVGQPAEVVSDIYGSSVTYHGTVVGIAGGTGSVFSVLPPQNATGNWIKIVQRLPVRINLDPEQIKQFPLRLGLSVETNIDIHDTQKPMFPAIASPVAIYSTDVFAKQELGAEELIEKVMVENLSPLFLQDMQGDE